MDEKQSFSGSPSAYLREVISRKIPLPTPSLHPCSALVHHWGKCLFTNNTHPDVYHTLLTVVQYVLWNNHDVLYVTYTESITTLLIVCHDDDILEDHSENTQGENISHIKTHFILWLLATSCAVKRSVVSNFSLEAHFYRMMRKTERKRRPTVQSTVSRTTSKQPITECTAHQTENALMPHFSKPINGLLPGARFSELSTTADDREHCISFSSTSSTGRRTGSRLTGVW